MAVNLIRHLGVSQSYYGSFLSLLPVDGNIRQTHHSSMQNSAIYEPRVFRDSLERKRSRDRKDEAMASVMVMVMVIGRGCFKYPDKTPLTSLNPRRFV